MFARCGQVEIKREYYLIDKEAVPETLLKTFEAKTLIEKSGVSVTEAVKKVGISRSAFYKYKDMIKRYQPLKMNKIVTLFIELEDAAGNLSTVLNIIARHGANVLTINQNIPINGKANISVSIDTQNMKKDISSLEKKLTEISDVRNLTAVGNE